MRNIMKKLSLEELGRIWTEALYWYIRKEKELKGAKNEK